MPNNPQFHRLVFVSAAIAPLGDLSDLDILRHSEKANEDAGLSGVLLRGSKWFCQYTEGGKGALEALLNRVQGDERHYSFQHWWGDPISARVFPSFTMGYPRAKGIGPTRFMMKMSAPDFWFEKKVALIRELAEEFFPDHDLACPGDTQPGFSATALRA